MGKETNSQACDFHRSLGKEWAWIHHNCQILPRKNPSLSRKTSQNPSVSRKTSFLAFSAKKDFFGKKPSRPSEKSISTSEKVWREHYSVVSGWNKYRVLGFRNECRFVQKNSSAERNPDVRDTSLLFFTRNCTQPCWCQQRSNFVAGKVAELTGVEPSVAPGTHPAGKTLLW